MALKGRAKTAYQQAYMQERRGKGPIAARLRSLGVLILEAHRPRLQQLREIDQAVLMLAQAGYLDQEIMESLALGEEALRAALERLAQYLAPTAASSSVEEAMPFDDGQDWGDPEDECGVA